MKRLLTSTFCAGMLLLGASSFADDMAKPDGMSKDSMSKEHKAMMKDCMAKQEAMKNGMSKDDMMKACKDEMKMKKDAMKKTP
jgi:pentapeptide MXKDX repeat protein